MQVDLRDVCSIPGSGRSPGGGRGNPLQYSFLKNPMDRGAWQATVHGDSKSWKQLKRLGMHALPIWWLLCLQQAPKMVMFLTKWSHPNLHSWRVWTICSPIELGGCSFPFTLIRRHDNTNRHPNRYAVFWTYISLPPWWNHSSVFPW